MHPAKNPGLDAHGWIERIAASQFGFGQHMAAHRGTRIVSGELAFNGKPRDVPRIQSENVVMNDRVVPWGTRSVVAEIIDGHLFVAREPSRVIVDAVPAFTRRMRTRLAPRFDAIRMRAARNAIDCRRQVDQD